MLSGLLVLSICGLTVASQGTTSDVNSVWIGSHYTDFSDYVKKAGEYNLGNDEVLPEIKLNYGLRGENYFMRLNSHYYDDKNIFGNLTGYYEDRLKFNVQYQSLIKQAGRDLLENLEARESVGGNTGGGKMLTHEVLDADADYNTHRQMITTEADFVIDKKHKVNLMVAHRTIMESGTEQMISNSHCFSCHITSRSADIDKITHQIIAGLQAEVVGQTIGYEFGFRSFKSNADEVYNHYDVAVNPNDSSAAGEFSSRLLYEDSTLPYGTYPETKKMSHKFRVKGDAGKGNYAAAISYSKAENNITNLASTAWVGSASYAVGLSPRTRLIARVKASRLRTDDTLIDLPNYREGTSAGPQTNFDFTRYSSLDRADARFSAEVISRLNKKVTASVLLGYDWIDRYDYPIAGEGLTTKRMKGQLKVRYRKGIKYSTFVKYRFEKTTDPFVSGRGLFEERGRDELNPIPETFRFVFYFQREDLRYQSITTEPTDEHIFEWTSRWMPDRKVNLTIGLKGSYDKNGDLDSLDINHLALRPNLNLNINPNMNWSINLGGNYGYYKSSGPITVALFDG